MALERLGRGSLRTKTRTMITQRRRERRGSQRGESRSLRSGPRKARAAGRDDSFGAAAWPSEMLREARHQRFRSLMGWVTMLMLEMPDWRRVSMTVQKAPKG